MLFLCQQEDKGCRGEDEDCLVTFSFEDQINYAIYLSQLDIPSHNNDEPTGACFKKSAEEFDDDCCKKDDICGDDDGDDMKSLCLAMELQEEEVILASTLYYSGKSFGAHSDGEETSPSGDHEAELKDPGFNGSAEEQDLQLLEDEGRDLQLLEGRDMVGAEREDRDNMYHPNNTASTHCDAPEDQNMTKDPDGTDSNYNTALASGTFEDKSPDSDSDDESFMKRNIKKTSKNGSFNDEFHPDESTLCPKDEGCLGGPEGEGNMENGGIFMDNSKKNILDEDCKKESIEQDQRRMGITDSELLEIALALSVRTNSEYQ